MKEAPPVTPMVDGEAKLFLMTPCNMQPESDRHIPTKEAVSILGSLNSQMSSLSGLSSAVLSPFIISAREKFTVPKDRQINMDNTAIIKSETSINTLRFSFFIKRLFPPVCNEIITLILNFLAKIFKGGRSHLNINCTKFKE